MRRDLNHTEDIEYIDIPHAKKVQKGFRYLKLKAVVTSFVWCIIPLLTFVPFLFPFGVIISLLLAYFNKRLSLYYLLGIALAILFVGSFF